MSTEKVRELGQALRERIGRVIIGQEEAVQLMMVALISEGHLLLRGAAGHRQDPARARLRRVPEAGVQARPVHPRPDAGRPGGHQPVQLPDQHLLRSPRGRCSPSSCWPTRSTARRPRPRRRCSRPCRSARSRSTAPRTRCRAGFMVVATQNPIEQEGTYPLPEAQLDRFLFKVLIGYPGRDEEVTMVQTHGHQTAMPKLDQLGLDAALRPALHPVGAAGGGGHPPGGRDGGLRGGPDPRHPQPSGPAVRRQPAGRQHAGRRRRAPPPCWRGGTS